MVDLRSITKRIVRSLSEVLHDHEKAQSAFEIIVYAALQLGGWQPVARALGRYAESHPEAYQIHEHIRPPAEPVRQLVDNNHVI